VSKEPTEVITERLAHISGRLERLNQLFLGLLLTGMLAVAGALIAIGSYRERVDQLRADVDGIRVDINPLRRDVVRLQTQADMRDYHDVPPAR
jgi:outer membrane murein-binding lipoprotein Lpp